MVSIKELERQLVERVDVALGLFVARAIKKPRRLHIWVLKGGAEWARTTDSRIFSPMLYQLSYSTVLNGVQN